MQGIASLICKSGFSTEPGHFMTHKPYLVLGEQQVDGGSSGGQGSSGAAALHNSSRFLCDPLGKLPASGLVCMKPHLVK